MGAISVIELRLKIALVYSRPKMLLGLEIKLSSKSPFNAFTVLNFAFAKDTPVSRFSFKSFLNSLLSSFNAVARRIYSSEEPLSTPKHKLSQTLRESIMDTAPLAKTSALAVAKTVGSSMTISAPAKIACLARVNLSKTAGSPRWVKLPLITAIILSAPKTLLI